MSQQQQKKPSIVSREDLSRQVWETLMFRLGEQYGLSGNGLKKICERLNVPYPARSYWAKLQAGKRVKLESLPDPSADTPAKVTITPTPHAATVQHRPQLDAETAERLRAATAKVAGVTVPTTLRRPHWGVAAWITTHEHEVAAAMTPITPLAEGATSARNKGKRTGTIGAGKGLGN